MTADKASVFDQGAADTRTQAPRTAAHLELFMGTRLGVATLLLGGALLLVLDDGRGVGSYTPRLLIGLIATMYAGSLVLALWLTRLGVLD